MLYNSYISNTCLSRIVSLANLLYNTWYNKIDTIYKFQNRSAEKNNFLKFLQFLTVR